MCLARHARPPQGGQQEKRVLHRNGLILHGMPDEDRRCVGGHLILQGEHLLCGSILAARQLDEAAPVGKLPCRDDRVAQNHCIGPLLGRLARNVQHRAGQGQMSARREAADGDLIRQDVPLSRILPQQSQRFVQLSERPVVLRSLPHAVGQHGGVIARRRKLQGHRVALPGADMVVTAARHHQHQRPLLHGGHGVQRRPQGNRQHTAACKFQLYLLHPSSSL